MGYSFETRWANSANYRKGRAARLTTIVIHHWGDPNSNPTLDGVVRWFQNPRAEVSAHYVVEDGRVVQMVPDGDTAWHAGNANPYSIGIECNPRCSEGDKRTVGELIGNLRAKYGNLKIVGHRDCMSTACPGRYYPPNSVLGPYINGGGGGGSSASAPAPGGDIDDLARRAIAGEFGNGDQRRAALGSRYDAVQARVNELLGGGGGGGGSSAPASNIDDLARRAIAGEFGNGDQRRAALGAQYDAVQARVNELLGGGGGSSSGPNIDDLARRAIAGEFGNGDERRRRLGGNYAAVQARVNQILGA